MQTTEFQTHSTFRCNVCNAQANVRLIETDGDEQVDAILCPDCGNTVSGIDATRMVNEFLLRYRDEKAGEVLRKELHKSKFGRVKLFKADNVFNDPRWPFTLKLEIND